MASDIGLGPISVNFADSEVVFRYTDPGAMTLEIPAHLDKKLRETMAAHDADVAEKPILVDLEGILALSSRQLGILLLIRTVCGMSRPVILRGISDPVESLLEVTKLTKLFQRES